jgi:hypothetical protein
LGAAAVPRRSVVALDRSAALLARARAHESIESMTYDLGTQWPGVLSHHDDTCPARDGRPCTCGPLGYRGIVEDPERAAPVLGPPVGTVEGARAWTGEHETAMESWRAASTRGDTVDEVVTDFLDAAGAGRTVDQQGQPYDPEALDELRWSLQGHVASELGAMRIADVRGTELRRLVRRLDASGLSAARTRVVVAAARALLRYAAQRGMVSWSAADTLVLGDEEGTARATGGASRPMPVVPGPQPTRTMSALATESAAPSPGYAPDPMTPIPGFVPDAVIWMILKIVALVFALIALVLVAESV